MIRVLLMYLMLLPLACSPVQRIAHDTNRIRDEARALVEHGKESGDQVVVDGATRIEEYASEIHETLPGVQDKTPEWLLTLKWWGIAVAAVAVVVFLWYSGIGQAIRIAIGWIPRKKVSQAELAVSMLDPDSQEDSREFIAAMRSDPEFDAAFRKAQQRRKKGTQ